MKQFLKSFLYFIPFVVVTYSLLTFVWGEFAPKTLWSNLRSKSLYTTPGSLYFRLQELKNIQDLDILFLGSSNTYRKFDTRLFEERGLKVFNLGSHAQTPIQTNILMKRHLDQLNVKTIIYEVNPGRFTSNGVEPSTDLLINGKMDLSAFEMAFNINSIQTYNALLYRIVRDIFTINPPSVKQPEQGSDRYIAGGYVEREVSYFKHLDYPKTQLVFNEDQFDAFEETLSMIKEKNIELILVYAPITSALYHSYTNIDSYDSLMHEYGRYYNFNTISRLNDSLHFYDPHHLNQKGVLIFNDKLLELLDEEIVEIMNEKLKPVKPS